MSICLLQKFVLLYMGLGGGLFLQQIALCGETRPALSWLNSDSVLCLQFTFFFFSFTRPEQCQFREKWLKDIIENKIVCTERLASRWTAPIHHHQYSAVENKINTMKKERLFLSSISTLWIHKKHWTCAKSAMLWHGSWLCVTVPGRYGWNHVPECK